MLRKLLAVIMGIIIMPTNNINQAYQWAVNTCNAPNVGYSQPYRNQLTVNGITYYDCSSFIWYALKAGGFDVDTAYQSATGELYSGNAITTAYLMDFLFALGFTEESISGNWKPGDIVWRQGHCEMVHTGGTGSGITMGAHTANTTLEKQVSINTSVSTNFTKIYRYGSGAGPGGGDLASSAYVCAAVCGNFWQESGIDPGVWQGLNVSTWDSIGHGYGLGQWTNADPTGRLYQLHEYLTSNGYSDDSGEGQLNFLIYENHWTPHSEYPFNTLSEFLQSQSTDLEMLTHAFNLCWEGIHDSTWDIRVQYAEQCLEYINAHGNETFYWISGNRYLNVDERLNNAILVYQFLNAQTGSGGGGGGGGRPPHKMKKHKMKCMFYPRKRNLIW